MEEIKAPKKERKFLKGLGEIALVIIKELVLGIGKKLINKVGNKRQGLSIALIIFASSFAFAQYPATGNKQRLGYQTSGDGLVWRGALSDTASIQPVSNQNAWLIIDTVNLKIYSFDFTSNIWGLVGGGTSGLTMPFDSITFNTAKDGTVGVGEIEYNDTQGSLIQGLKGGLVTNVIGQQLHQRVNNRTGATLAKGTAVYLSGSQGNRITVAKALGVTDAFSASTFGIVAESIANNQSGYVITEGLITNINTSSLVEDSAVYLSPTVAGGLTSTKPQAPQHTVYIGVCVKSNAGSGELFVKIRNGQELDELHDVRITSPVNKASLYYLSSGGVWRDTTASLLVSDTASMLTNYLQTGVASSTYQTKLNGTGFVKASGTTITYDNSTYLTSSTGVSTFSAGSTGFTPSSATSGAITLGGTLALTNGGTGATSASAARTALGATVRGANTFLLTDIGAISFLRYNADNTVSQRAADGMRSDLGGTTIGQSMFTLTNPSAVTFPRFNADNTVSALDAETFRTAIGAGTGTGTVTSVTGTLPISVATGTSTPVISVANAGVSTTGVVTANTQTFGGTKTFNGVLNASSDLNVTGISTLSGGAIIGLGASMTKIAGLNVSNALGSITVGSGLSLTSGTLTATAANLVNIYLAINGPGITLSSSFGDYSHWYVNINQSSTVSITLPSASGNTNKTLVIKNSGSGAVNSNSTNVEPLNSTTLTTSILTSGGGKFATLVSNGTNWIIMQAN